MSRGLSLLIIIWSTVISAEENKNRARDFGIPFEGQPGRKNGITDVPGVTVGHATLIEDIDNFGDRVKGVRTGVTAILPRGNQIDQPVFAGWFSLHGNGEMTGTSWIEESGSLEGPILITNTHSVGIVRDAVVEWSILQKSSLIISLPVVAETWDGLLNDINGFHVEKSHVYEALNKASGGQVKEGNVGGGTGMVAHRFKGGIGTSSRIADTPAGQYTVGVLVQANYGLRDQLLIAGIPVGREISDLMPEIGEVRLKKKKEERSIIIVIATDAPLLPHQLKGLARRAALGLARVGSVSTYSSGDLFIAFSTYQSHSTQSEWLGSSEFIKGSAIDPIYTSVVEAVEESIVNALVAAETMIGNGGNKVYALPVERVRAILDRHGRLKSDE